MSKYLELITKIKIFVVERSHKMDKLQPYSSVLAARYLRALACKHGNTLNMTQVQKLLYIAYGSILQKYNFPFIDEHPRAWPFGPVFPKTRNTKHIDYDKQEDLSDHDFSQIKNDCEINEVLEHVVTKYSTVSAGALSSWSHSPGGPWDRVVRETNEKWNTVIPDEYIREYFTKVKV